MKYNAILLILGFFMAACYNTSSYSSEETISQVDSLEIGNHIVKLGQVLKFRTDSMDLRTIVMDISEYEGEQWIGLCFIDQNRLFGRQIPNGMINTTCADLIDLTCINSDTKIDFTYVETIAIDKSKIEIGSQGWAKNLEELESSYNWGIEQRKKEQTPCSKGITDLSAVRECYFDMETFKVNK